eukprot:CAMPEP_0168455548 /NCGR_PEP_ID=MMETSP0228-20121227/50808_1 /TAXON_ID=133427 /ORGANISM="Protoceratium reticulatum, Strain CCCM 535 (=CCMP 1889)" /LENGTH=196 /DNA_ID=CAMNT_0008470399 /DNA_START=207 /DNA_END=798 /DNA_ORIENTATION=-
MQHPGRHTPGQEPEDHVHGHAPGPNHDVALGRRGDARQGIGHHHPSALRHLEVPQRRDMHNLMQAARADNLAPHDHIPAPSVQQGGDPAPVVALAEAAKQHETDFVFGRHVPDNFPKIRQQLVPGGRDALLKKRANGGFWTPKYAGGPRSLAQLYASFQAPPACSRLSTMITFQVSRVAKSDSAKASSCAPAPITR